jgi:hypothetical protein
LNECDEWAYKVRVRSAAVNDGERGNSIGTLPIQEYNRISGQAEHVGIRIGSRMGMRIDRHSRRHRGKGGRRNCELTKG